MIGLMCRLGLGAACAACWAQEEAEFVLVRDGRPVSAIVLAREPTPAAEFAAAELAYHVEKITDATLPVVREPEEVKGPRILVGESEATRELGLRTEELEAQEYLVRFLPDTLVLMGRDEAQTAAEGGGSQPAWVEGRYGKGLEFDGLDDIITIPDCGFSDEAGTLEAWVWLPEEPQQNHGTILRLDGRDPWTYHIIQRPQGASTITYVTYDGAKGNGVTSRELVPGWHHIAATHSLEAGTIELFIDGASQGTAECLRTTCAGAVLGIGALPAPPGQKPGNPLRGRVDEVRVSKVVRQPTEDSLAQPLSRDAETTLLLHCDEGRGQPKDSSGRANVANPPGWFEARGTLDAVYHFLERFCDVRWYAPGELGLVHPRKQTLEVKGEDVRRAPAMQYRWMTPTSLYMPTPDDKLPAGDVLLWKLRLRLGGEPFAANHSFYGYYDRFMDEHPEWFAQGYEGKPPQPCFTNEGFVEQVVQDARDYFDGKATHTGAQAMGDFFALVPMDNGRWCTCERCQAELDPAERDSEQFTNGKASNMVFGFVSRVAREVAKTHPDKWIAALAYADYAQYPSQVEPEPNVAVMMCLTARHWWAPGMKQADLKMLDTWAAQSGGQRPLYLWLYYCFPALNAMHGKYNAFPSFSGHTVVEQMRMYHEAGIRGIFLEHSSEFGQSFLLDQLELYLTWTLADDPTLNGEALIDEYFSRYYGPAAAPMKAFYEQVERIYGDPNSYPPEVRELPGKTEHQNEEIAWRWLGAQEPMAELQQLMDRATAAATEEPYRERVALFRKGIWEYMAEGRRTYVERDG